MQASRLLIGVAVAALLLPVQDRADSAPPTAAPSPSNIVQSTQPSAPSAGSLESLVEEVTVAELPPPPPPVEIPAHARRDPTAVGVLDPSEHGLSADPWRGASGPFLSTLLRRMNTPLASRWAHIALRDALLARSSAPRNVNPVDWVGERAWLLLRLGEADGARMLVSGVDVDRFTPKMFQVAMQSALANADPSGLCPIEGGLQRVERRVYPLIQSMCSALAGEPESADAQIDSARRRGSVGGVDLVLAEKVVGAGSDTRRAVNVEWEPVERLNTWRFGLATATGMTFPDRLTNSAPARVRAWQARAPLLSAAQRLESARIATGLGVFSSQSLIDLYATIYDATDANDLSGTDAWQLHLAYFGRDREAKLAAMRRLWVSGDDSYLREGSRAVLGRAASRIAPDAELQSDAPQLIASMLAAGLDRHAARWANVVQQMDDEAADRSWAMLALAAPGNSNVDVSAGRVSAFIGRDNSPGKQRSALLVAGLAGLGRLDLSAAGRLNSRYGLGLNRKSRWTQMIDGAAALRQPGTVALLTATGLQAPRFSEVPSAHLFHAVAAMRRTGQEFSARMIAAEALSRT